MVSSQLHELEIGDKVLLSPPFGIGIKYANPNNKKVVSITAGIGITVLVSILKNINIELI